MHYGIVLDSPDGWYRHRCSSDYWSSRVVVSGDGHVSPAWGRDDCHVACGDYRYTGHPSWVYQTVNEAISWRSVWVSDRAIQSGSGGTLLPLLSTRCLNTR